MRCEDISVTLPRLYKMVSVSKYLLFSAIQFSGISVFYFLSVFVGIIASYVYV